MTHPSQPQIPFADKPLSAPTTAADAPQTPLERNWLTMLAKTAQTTPKPTYHHKPRYRR